MKMHFALIKRHPNYGGKTIMVTEKKDSKKDHKSGSDDQASKNDAMRLPHERDQSPSKQDMEPREVMIQAASDLEQGLVDTDLHGIRGVEKVAPVPPRSAQPIPKKGGK